MIKYANSYSKSSDYFSKVVDSSDNFALSCQWQCLPVPNGFISKCFKQHRHLVVIVRSSYDFTKMQRLSLSNRRCLNVGILTIFTNITTDLTGRGSGWLQIDRNNYQPKPVLLTCVHLKRFKGIFIKLLFTWNNELQACRFVKKDIQACIISSFAHRFS